MTLKYWAICIWLGTAVGAAAESAPDSVAGTAPESLTLREIIQTGGWPMYALGAMSVAGVALIFYFMFALRRDQVAPRELIERLKGLVIEGRWVEARAACRNDGSALAAIIGAALDYVLRTPKPDPGLLREIVEGEGGRQATLIQNQTQYLLDIAAIAPMIGLLGTVLGMLRAFNSVALDLAKAKPMLLAGGVSQALVTTVAGLIVAIPAMVAYAYFRGRVSRLISELEKQAAELVSMLQKE
ncbi:MAG: MotA/TolQ/ExbB proton channel family protein [Kiritimatiellae bacterium]|nr:MotA/TolQ/ExbB proton channel family protein [Kiritimatiellia bacterium]MDW8458659.1 MotA/TolQ/ExbB proton channel family protein [Verrucomicrobiota bacterium]